MAKKRKNTRHRSKNKRRRNPMLAASPHRRRRRYAPVTHHRRRRNPRTSFRSIGIRRFVEGGLWAAGGGLFTRAVPGFVASSYNNGWAGYLMNAAAALAASWLGSFVSADAALFAGVGGFSALILRVVQDYGGGNIPGMSGDIDHLGYFVESGFPVPVASDWSALVPANPRLSYTVGAAAPAALPAGAPTRAAATVVPMAAAMSPANNPGVARWGGGSGGVTNRW